MKKQNLHKIKYLWATVCLVLFQFQISHAADTSTNECSGTQRFDEKLNRCVSTESTLKNQSEYKECEGKSSSEERSACYEQKAKEQVAKVENSGNYNKGVQDDLDKSKIPETIMNSSFATASIWAMIGKDKNASSCTSTKIFAATSTISVVKNLFLEKDIKDKTGKMAENFDKESKAASNMKDAQVRAFDYLEEEQKYLQKYANDQKKLYNYITMGYVAAGAMAAYEGVTTAFMQQCGTSEDTAKKPEASSNPVSAFLSKYLNTPAGTLIASGLAAGVNYTLANGMGEKAEEAGENVSTIQKLREKYLASITTYCPDGRDSLTKPYCYCYTDEGKKNPNRTKSNTCQNLWKDSKSLFADVDDAIRGSGLRNAKGCVYADGKFDAACECKRLKNSSGDNACLKVSLSSSSLSGVPGVSATTLSSSLNKLTGSADASGSDITDSSSAQAATAMKDFKNLVKKVTPALEKESKLKLDQLEKNLTAEAQKAVGNSRVAIYHPAAAAFAGSRPDSSAIDALTQEIAKSNPAFASSTGNYSKKKETKKNLWNFDNSESSSGVLNFSDIKTADKKYNYGSSDITTDKSASIWNVISKRYNQSGLRRLFDDGSEQKVIQEE